MLDKTLFECFINELNESINPSKTIYEAVKKTINTIKEIHNLNDQTDKTEYK